ncbi:MAG: ABC transporter permease [Actinobacteria bacterium]|nr:ABC transporter permease [Actinomycetota bacterium]
MLGLMSIGMTFVIIGGGIDLSVGSIYGLTAILVGILLPRLGGNAFPGVVAGVLIGMFCGLINGLIIVYGRIPPFIVTLGMLNMARGIALIMTKGYPATLYTGGVTNETNPFFYFIGQGYVSVIPMQFIIFIIFFAIGVFVLHRTPLGIYFYAIGGSEDAARICGVNVGKIRLIGFIISGFMCSIAGILALSFMGSILPTAGSGMEFDTITAVVIGGTSLAGGQGSLVGTFIGVIIIGMIRNALVLLGVDAFWQTFIIGAILVVAVLIDSLTQRRFEILKR